MDHTDVTERRAERPADGRVIAGVCAGVAEHLGVPVLWVRVGFALGMVLNGVTVLAYAILWRFMPLRRTDSLGAASTTRVTQREIGQVIAIGAVVLGVLGLLVVLGPIDVSMGLVPFAILAIGVAVVWRLVDDATLNTWIRQTSGLGFWLRLGVGVLMVVAGLIAVFGEGRGLGALMDFGAAMVLAVLGIALLLGPWAIGMWKDLQEERGARVRSQERAEVAAHLHDSVLQTLALLQKNAKDPALVATMARRQERELRAWLYGDDGDAEESFAAALQAAAADVEGVHHVAVEVVTVGDARLDSDLRALVAAAREAIVNSAKHADADKVDVYAEVHGTEVEVFVRDRGKGFDPADIDPDRRGIRYSIIERTERHGGRVQVRSAPGEGTEVRLFLTLDHQESS